MSESELSYRAVVVVGAPRKLNDRIIWAKGIHDTMHGNARYTSMTSKLTTLDTDTTALETAQAGFSAKPRTVSKAERDKDDKTVKTDITGIVAGVQALADADPANAAAIITEAGFKVKKISKRGKQQNCVVQGENSGSVYIYGAGKGPHNFRISMDGETWVNLLGSKDSRKYHDGIKPGTLCYFQTAKALKDGMEGVWSQTMSIIVI